MTDYRAGLETKSRTEVRPIDETTAHGEANFLLEEKDPDRIVDLLEIACEQQLRIASKLEEILDLLNGPDEDTMLARLQSLLEPIAVDAAAIKSQLGI